MKNLEVDWTSRWNKTFLYVLLIFTYVFTVVSIISVLICFVALVFPVGWNYPFYSAVFPMVIFVGSHYVRAWTKTRLR